MHEETGIPVELAMGQDCIIVRIDLTYESRSQIRHTRRATHVVRSLEQATALLAGIWRDTIPEGG